MILVRNNVSFLTHFSIGFISSKIPHHHLSLICHHMMTFYDMRLNEDIECDFQQTNSVIIVRYSKHSVMNIGDVFIKRK
jgi:hypothetical protein